jgi:hypothetical protein
LYGLSRYPAVALSAKLATGGVIVSEAYPKPPWRTHGSGLAIPCIVSARNVSVPDEFRVMSTAGRTLGLLLYLEYVDPSPMTHRELLWLSAIVRCTDRAYDVPRIGPMYYVAKAYVDDGASLAAGRREWSLPRSLAHFARRGNRIEVDAEDGTHVAFSWKPRGFTFPAPANISTLQKGAGRVICFQAQGRARVQLATYRLEAFASEQPEWQSFASGLVLPGLASYLKSFDMTLRAPMTVTRRLESIAPAPSLV